MADAVDLRLVNHNTLLYVIGKIEAGDAARVRDVLRKAGPSVEALILRSVGGSMYDSMEIGTLAYDLMLNTFAPYAPNYCATDDAGWGISRVPCTCVSGCFLIWMGGVNRYGTVVGMHRPWDTSGTMGKLNYPEAGAIYKKWIADLDVYLTKMELPQAYFAKFISTVRSGDMHMLSGADLLQLNENPSKGEWLSNRCGQWSSQDNNEIGELNFAQYQGRSHNSARRQQLIAKLSAIQTCKTSTQAQARREAFEKIF
jgi:hypothetical protein